MSLFAASVQPYGDGFDEDAVNDEPKSTLTNPERGVIERCVRVVIVVVVIAVVD